MFFVYVLKSKKTGEIYIGCTIDLDLRLKQHNEGKSFATKSKIPWELVYYEAFKDEQDAFMREKMLKYDGRGREWLKKRIKRSLDLVRA